MSDLLRSAYAAHLQSQSAALAQMQASQRAMAQQAGTLNSFANGAYAPNVTPIKAGIAPPPPRTPEQIIADLEARYAELQTQAIEREREDAVACRKCAWYDDRGLQGVCENALVTGFEGAWYLSKGTPNLCGPEKALWEPKPPKRSLWARFVDWFLAPWNETVPD